MRKVFYAPILFFVVFMFFLICFELYQGRQNYYTIMESRATEIIKTVISFREWMAELENVYADTDKLKPNPYLSWRDDRDINTDGLHLTLVNPSYMTRLLSVKLNSTEGLTLHLAGIDPMNPYNAASEWEQKAFDAFRAGQEKYTEKVRTPLKEISFRYMQPLYLNELCLNCHAQGNFRPGDLIGGLSIELPADKVSALLFKGTLRNVSFYIIMSVLLSITISMLQRRIYSMSLKQEETINTLNKEINLRERTEMALAKHIRVSSQGELLSLVAHHWRQPLNAISLTLDVVKEYLEENKLNDKDSIGYINQSQMLIQDLSSTIELFRGQFVDGHVEDTFSVAHAIKESVKTILPVLQSMDIKIWIKCGLGQDIETVCFSTSNYNDQNLCRHEQFRLKGSANDLRQILMVVIKNSYEAIRERRKSEEDAPKGIILISTIFKYGYLHISVRDNGIGVTPQITEQAFEPYFTTKGYESGLGTGLYQAKILAEKFEQGNIVIQTVDGYTEVVFSAKLEK